MKSKQKIEVIPTKIEVPIAPVRRRTVILKPSILNFNFDFAPEGDTVKEVDEQSSTASKEHLEK